MEFLISLRQHPEGDWIAAYTDGPDVASVGRSAPEALERLANATASDARHCGGIEAIPMLRGGKRI